MMDLIIAVFLISGAAFMLLAALGILRLPDLPTRMHSSTKAGAMGAMLIMVGVVLGFAEWLALARGLAIVLFIMMTTPIAAHAIGRAGYIIGVPLWDGTIKDELRENYDTRTHGLRSDAADQDEPRL
ncbi:monovalent cation/H(+) antiporter subunit G [Vreelandella utahensis]|uniref:monovalent cation/H(+) antiporter subunit G n=1 Tax=Vreelandella halophila TaxID=86177 RepID=UPI0009857437|nr:monovalent cation/H(+) antiporter subunit G [Halomonas utahensis]